jgi:uncharacterized sulfatase
VPAGSVSATPAITHDIYPTLLELAGAARREDQPLDGVSLVQVLANPTHELTRDSLFWHLPHYHHSTPASAIRQGDWKLIEFFETNERQLFNLRTDIGESHNLVAAEPARAEKMHFALQAWQEKVGARMPTPNPDFDAVREKELAGKKNAGKGKR